MFGTAFQLVYGAGIGFIAFLFTLAIVVIICAIAADYIQKDWW